MTKVFLSETNNRFFNGLKNLSDPNIQIYSHHPVDIYRIHHHIIADIYIFDASYISNEIMQFINEHSDVSIKVFIYHDLASVDKDIIRYVKKANHILVNQLFEQFSQYKNTICLPQYIINDKIFFKKNSGDRVDRAIYLLDRDTIIPENISKELYPNNKNSHILLFNNPNISHPQNLGLVSESDKQELFNTYKYFIPNKYNDYIVEAIVCGCDILDNTLSAKVDIDLSQTETTTFQQFLRKIL